MNRSTRLLCVLATLSTILCGCQTILGAGTNRVEMAEEAVRALAIDIEKAIMAGERTPEIQPPAGLSIESDLIKQAIRTRAARAELVQEHLAAGHIFEKDNGLVAIYKSEATKSLSRDQRTRVASIVIGENNDRWNIYEGLIDASNLRLDSLSGVQRIFHETRVALIPTGSAYQNDTGDIVEKTGP